MVRPYKIRAYHVTEQTNGTSILATGFNRSRNSYDWLGYGIYFYQEAPKFAIHWATKERVEGAFTDPCLLGIDIEYRGFLDLLDYGQIDILRAVYDGLSKKAGKRFSKIKSKQKPFIVGGPPSGHALDRYVIEAAARLLQKQGIAIRAVRAVFLSGQPIYDKSHLTDREHIQIAVRDPSLLSAPWQETADP